MKFSFTTYCRYVILNPNENYTENIKRKKMYFFLSIPFNILPFDLFFRQILRFPAYNCEHLFIGSIN